MSILPSSYAKKEAPQGDYVIILHGIARSSAHMKKLANYLHNAGYDVINLDYPSTQHTLEELTDLIHEMLLPKLTESKPVHFVGYSMGGLLVRTLIHRYPPKNLGRVVQLAPPNHGSEVADFLQHRWLYKKFYGPAGQQLITDQTATQHLFGDITYELGIIAGDFTVDPISSMLIPGDDDGKVSVVSTKLTGMKSHITLSVSHMFFPSNPKVHECVVRFLSTGAF